MIEQLIDQVSFRKRKPVFRDEGHRREVGLTGEIDQDLDSLPDRLELIKGIGPVIARKFNDAGVFTFKQLAELSPAQIEQIVGQGIKGLTDEEGLIAQAKKHADLNGR